MMNQTIMVTLNAQISDFDIGCGAEMGDARSTSRRVTAGLRETGCGSILVLWTG